MTDREDLRDKLTWGLLGAAIVLALTLLVIYFLVDWGVM